jgi:hypothetical protein
MSDVLLAQAATAIRNARNGYLHEDAESAPGTPTVRTSDIVFSLDADQLRDVQAARARTRRVLSGEA